jgi:hypothetical protein
VVVLDPDPGLGLKRVEAEQENQKAQEAESPNSPPTKEMMKNAEKQDNFG